jgi:heat shock protein HslJ
MAGPPRAMAFEKIFLERLGAVTGYEVDGDTLRLRAGDNEALTFERRAERPTDSR